MVRIGTDCSGIEAPLFALRRLNVDVDHVFSCEINRQARNTLLANHSPRHMYHDVTKRNHQAVPRVDLYVAGFPCQSHSAYGRQRGMDDPRATIFDHCVQYIRRKAPRVFVLENVPHIKSVDRGRAWRHVTETLDALERYQVDTMVLNTRDYGIPQNRRRLFIIGRRRDRINGPLRTPRPVRRCPGIVEFLGRLKNLDVSRRNNPRLYRRWPCERNPEKYDRLRRKYGVKHLTKHPIVTDLGSSVGFPTDAYDCSPTLRAVRASLWITCLRRKMHVRESLALQGFPRSFKIVASELQTLKQVGNSMSVNVLRHLFREIFRTTAVE